MVYYGRKSLQQKITTDISSNRISFLAWILYRKWQRWCMRRLFASLCHWRDMTFWVGWGSGRQIGGLGGRGSRGCCPFVRRLTAILMSRSDQSWSVWQTLLNAAFQLARSACCTVAATFVITGRVSGGERKWTEVPLRVAFDYPALRPHPPHPPRAARPRCACVRSCRPGRRPAPTGCSGVAAPPAPPPPSPRPPTHLEQLVPAAHVSVHADRAVGQHRPDVVVWPHLPPPRPPPRPRPPTHLEQLVPTAHVSVHADRAVGQHRPDVVVWPHLPPSPPPSPPPPPHPPRAARPHCACVRSCRPGRRPAPTGCSGVAAPPAPPPPSPRPPTHLEQLVPTAHVSVHADRAVGQHRPDVVVWPHLPPSPPPCRPGPAPTPAPPPTSSSSSPLRMCPFMPTGPSASTDRM